MRSEGLMAETGLWVRERMTAELAVAVLKGMGVGVTAVKDVAA